MPASCMWQADTTVTFACGDVDAADTDVVISGGSIVLAIVVGELVATSVVHGMVDPPRRQLLECVSLYERFLKPDDLHKTILC
jgi:hypothetical protein